MDANRPRPRIHFTPRSGWINDPLALTWHGGLYHLFFQFVPNRTTWAPECRWGHATSVDLLNWTEHPVVLEPGDGDDGVWSGSIAVDDDGGATLFYTSVSVPDFGIGRIRTATPTDASWMHWQKGEFVVEAPDLDLIAFRDPFVMRDGDRWRMLVGTALRGGTAAAAGYTSNDLRSWSYDGLAASRDSTETEGVWSGALWECPQVFEIDGRHVLITSVWQDDELHYVAYGVGEFVDGSFDVEHWGRLTYGSSYYAPSFFRDREGRPCLIFWMRGVLDEAAGRASALSVPHELSLRGNTLVAEPHAALGDPKDSPDVGPFEQPAYFWWRAGENSELCVGASDGSHVVIRRRGDVLVAETDGSEVSLPLSSDRVRVLIDGETLELFTDRAVLGIGADHAFISAESSNPTGTAAQWRGQTRTESGRLSPTALMDSSGFQKST
jgi:beta-fructofuranosidase